MAIIITSQMQCNFYKVQKVKNEMAPLTLARDVTLCYLTPVLKNRFMTEEEMENKLECAKPVSIIKEYCLARK